MKMFGFAIPGLGFYSIEVPDKGNQSKFSGVITIQEGVTMEEMLEEELKNLVDANWDF